MGTNKEYDEIAESPDGRVFLVDKDTGYKPIKWGDTYLEWDKDEKIDYLEKLSSSLNHSVILIQKERDYLNEVAINQEKQIEAYEEKLANERQMIQMRLIEENKKQQELSMEIVALKQEIKKLKQE